MSFLAALLNGWPPSKHRFEGSCNLVCKLPLWMQISFPLLDLGNSLSLVLREKQYWSQNGFNNMSPQKLWGVMAQRGPAPIIDPIPGTPNRSHTGHTKIFLSINESACGWDARAAFHPVTSLFVKAPAQNVRHAAKVVKDATRCNPQGLWSKPQMGAQAMIEIL